MTRRPITSVLISTFAVFASFSQLLAQEAKPTPSTTPVRLTRLGTVNVFADDRPPNLLPAQTVRWNSFIKVWSTLSDNYFDRTFNGLDWNKVKAVYRPRVIAAKTDEELHRILDEMIQRLDRSHFAIIPADVLQTLDLAKREAKKRGRQLSDGNKHNATGDDQLIDDDLDFFDEHSRFGIGVDLRILDGKFVVTYVDPTSAAKLAGIQRGYVIDKINGVSLSEMARRITFSYPNLKNLQRYLPIQIVSWFLNGEKDSLVAVSCLDENDQPKEFKMARMRLTGEAVSIGSNYPPQFLDFEARSIDADTGYIKFNLFSFDVVEKFCSALSDLKDKKALVIDLRGNLGGLFGVLNGVSGMLTDRSLNFGTSIFRSGSEPFNVIPRVKHFPGRVVLIVDNQSVSAAELFASGLRENDRVLIVGTTTAGEALPAGSIDLPTGAVFMYPLADFKSRSGKSIEGIGVSPDFAVQLDRATLLKDVDAPLDKALALIRENKGFPTSKIEVAGPQMRLDLPPPPKPTPKPIRADDGDPPPPPKAIASANGTSPLPPPPVAIRTGGGLSAIPGPKTPDVKDEKSLQVIAVFLRLINADEYKELKTYEAKGTGKLGVRGTTAPITFVGYRQFPDKFAFTVRLDSAGEIREVHNGKAAFVESDVGVQKELPPSPDSGSSEIFGAITLLTDLSKFNSLKYLGTYDREGRKSHIIDGRFGYIPVALAFDVETKMLVSFTSNGPPITFGDYRKVGTIMLPFHVAIERTYDIELSEIKLNIPVDESHFKKKENCFDKPL